MNNRRGKLLIVSVLAIGAVVVIWAVVPSSPPVSLRILGFNAERWTYTNAQGTVSMEQIMASIAFSNGSSRSISYWAQFRPENPAYERFDQTPTGWKEVAVGFSSGTGMNQYTLAPSQVVTFSPVVDRNTPCKISLSYTEDHAPSRLRQRLPEWITERLPGAGEWKTVTTEVIDLRGAAGQTVKPPEPFLKPPEETSAVQAERMTGIVLNPR